MSKAKSVSRILEKYSYRMLWKTVLKMPSLVGGNLIADAYEASDQVSGIATGFATLSELSEVTEPDAFQIFKKNVEKGGIFHIFLAAAIIEVIGLYNRTYSLKEINSIVVIIRDIVENVCKKDTLTEGAENILKSAAKVGLFVLSPATGLQSAKQIDVVSDTMSETEIFHLSIKTVYLVLDSGIKHFDIINMNYDELKNYALKAKNLDLE